MSVPQLTPTAPNATAWIGFQPCCGGNILYFSVNGTTNPPNPGINIYNGFSGVGYDPITNTYIGLSNQCYRIFRGDATDIGSPITAANYLNLNVVPTNFGGTYVWDSTTNYETPCGGETITCPDCPTPLYVVWPCDGSLVPVVTDTDLSGYVNGYASIQVNADGGFDCYYVVNYSVITNLSPSNPIQVVVDGDLPCSCDCTCYEVTGSGKLYYIDCDGLVQAETISGYWKGCTLVYPQGGPNYNIVSGGNCINNECPIPCYELTDCNGLLDPIHTTVQALGEYAILGQIVQIANYDNCWIVDSIVSCDCAINVVVLQAYDTCEQCNPAPNYLLTNCDDLNTIIYTSSDLSANVGQVINIETGCPGNWIVEEYPNPIPSDIPVVVQDSFLDCDAAKAVYYILTDCIGVRPEIITSTDMSQYLGDVITLDWCPSTCWTVAVSQTSANAGVLADIGSSFRSCDECIASFPCVCSKLKNHDTEAHVYTYLDCEGNLQTITIQAGATSERMCLIAWLTSFETDYVEYFGNCIEGVCPPPVYPKRSLKPGYNTPYCSTWKYEEISCKSAEALYKQVLELRYGITNCCPEEDQQYIIQKQLIDLKALVNPDYVCATPSCGCNTGCNCGGSCSGGSGCGCSSGTCHS